MDSMHGRAGGGDLRGIACVTPFFSSFWSVRVPARMRGDLSQQIHISSTYLRFINDMFNILGWTTLALLLEPREML